jgi:[acyl-carrier-protein] S-malonyltransferase
MRVALTGATGFLGLRLLAELLDRGHEVAVLVRTSPQRATVRLERGLRALGRLPAEVDTLLSRVDPYEVDLAAEHFGLPVDAFRELADGVDAVWHSAGQIALSGNAEKSAINVTGTRRVLELATQGRRRPMVHHISTAFVAGRRRKGVVLESDLGHDHGFVNSYEETKHRAEILVDSWSHAHGRPAVVYRPSVLVSDLGAHPDLPIHPMATLSMLLEQLFGSRGEHTGAIRPLRILGHPDSFQNMLQVEYAARMIIQLSEVTAPGEKVTTYHVVHPQDTPISRTLAMLETTAPVALTMTELDDGSIWRPTGQPELAGYLPYFGYERRYDTAASRSAGVVIEPPEITTEYLTNGVRWRGQARPQETSKVVMNTPSALLFPGQGAYLPGGLGSLLKQYPRLVDVLTVVDNIAAEYRRAPVSPLLRDPTAPSAEELIAEDPARSNLAIFACSMALHQVLVAEQGMTFDVLLGHSFGEIAALTAAGVVSLEDGARLVAERDAAFEKYPPRPGGMLSLTLSESRTEHLLAAVGSFGAAVAAANAPAQTVVSGLDEDLAAIQSIAEAAGVSCTRVRAPYAFHNRALWTVAEEWRTRLAAIPFREPRTRVHSPIAQDYYGPGDDLREAVVSHLVRPVRFAETVRRLHAEGIGTFVECGARSILTDLVTQNLPGVSTQAPLRGRTTVTRTPAKTSTESPRTPEPAPTPRQDLPSEPVPSSPEPSLPKPPSTVDPLPPHPQLVELLRREYAQALDYPEDVFTDDADLEADLGVDSLKQVEMFSRLRRRFNLPAASEGVRATAYRTLPAIADGLTELAAGAL